MKVSKRQRFYLMVAVISSILGVGVYGFASWTLGNGIFRPWWGTILTVLFAVLAGLSITMLTDISSYHYGSYGESWLDKEKGKKGGL